MSWHGCHAALPPVHPPTHPAVHVAEEALSRGSLAILALFSAELAAKLVVFGAKYFLHSKWVLAVGGLCGWAGWAGGRAGGWAGWVGGWVGVLMPSSLPPFLLSGVLQLAHV